MHHLAFGGIVLSSRSSMHAAAATPAAAAAATATAAAAAAVTVADANSSRLQIGLAYLARQDGVGSQPARVLSSFKICQDLSETVES